MVVLNFLVGKPRGITIRDVHFTSPFDVVLVTCYQRPWYWLTGANTRKRAFQVSRESSTYPNKNLHKTFQVERNGHCT